VTGLYSFRFREYDPAQGRWKQADPAGYVDGGSLYQAYRSSPVSFLDPLGLQSIAGQAANAGALATAALALLAAAQSSRDPQALAAAASALERAIEELKTTIFVATGGASHTSPTIQAYEAQARAARELLEAGEHYLAEASKGIRRRSDCPKDPCDFAKRVVENLRARSDGLRRVLDEHRDKIKNPTNYMDRVPHTQENIDRVVKHWTNEIPQIQKVWEQIDVGLKLAQAALEVACRGK